MSDCLTYAKVRMFTVLMNHHYYQYHRFFLNIIAFNSKMKMNCIRNFFLVNKISHWSYLNRSNSIRFRINHKRKQLSNQLILPAERDYKRTNQCVQFERMKEKKKHGRARARFSSLLSFSVIALYFILFFFFRFRLRFDRSVGRFIAQHTPSLLPRVFTCFTHGWHTSGARTELHMQWATALNYNNSIYYIFTNGILLNRWSFWMPDFELPMKM